MVRLVSIARQLRLCRWGLGSAALAALVGAVVPAAQIRGGAATLNGLIGSYMYEVDIPVTVAPGSPAVTDVYHPFMTRIEWGAGPTGSQGYSVERWLGAERAALGGKPVGSEFWQDGGGALGTEYQYAVSVSGYESGPYLNLPAPPANLPDSMSGEVYVRTFLAGPAWLNADTAAFATTVGDNQTVDSRLDTRYDTPTLLDYRFRGGTYKGGLFAGNVQDPSKVSRSLLKFQAAPAPYDANLWVGTLNAYSTEHLGTMDVASIGCQGVANTWDAGSLKWTLTPTMDPTAAPSTGRWNDENWVRWTVTSQVANALAGDGVFSLGLASKQEGGSGWYYFAKKEYDAALAARLMSAWQSKRAISSLTVADFGSGSQTTTGTVVLTGPAPAGGCRVALYIAGPLYGAIPDSVYIPAGQASGAFTVTWTGGPTGTKPWYTMTGTLNVVASYNGSTKSVAVTRQ